MSGPREAQVDKLARAFARSLRASLTGDEMKQVIRANRDENDQRVCHSHDVIDANVVMAEAFEHVVGREAQVQWQTDLDLWNDAWTAAKRHEFWQQI